MGPAEMADVATPTQSDHEVLGVARHASPHALRAAYRRAALLHHPDRNPGDEAAATKRFQRIFAAYERLFAVRHHTCVPKLRVFTKAP